MIIVCQSSLLSFLVQNCLYLSFELTFIPGPFLCCPPGPVHLMLTEDNLIFGMNIQIGIKSHLNYSLTIMKHIRIMHFRTSAFLKMSEKRVGA